MDSLETTLQRQPKISFKTLDANDQQAVGEVAALKRRIYGEENSFTAEFDL